MLGALRHPNKPCPFIPSVPNYHTASLGSPSATEMQQQERHHPRVTFALPPPSPSPPPQQEKGSTSQSQSQLHPVGPKGIEEKRQVRAPPTLTPAQLIAHAAGPPSNGGGTKNHVSKLLSSSSSSPRWTLSYPRLRRVADGNPLPGVESNTSWPGGVISYQRLPSCYDSPAFSAGPIKLMNSTRSASASASSQAPRILDSGGETRGTTMNPRPRNGNPPLDSASGGTNPHRPRTSKKPWAWTWTPGAAAAPIYDPDYTEGPPQCLAPRPTLPVSLSADMGTLNADARRIGRSAAMKPLREGEAITSVDQEDTRSTGSGGSSADSYVSSDESQLFTSELGSIGPIGTVESVWGEPLSDFRGLRL
ncbi:hypothetical protein M407DRAFT_29426 [Tulasnella calospora MUT 4182]|uniref:Uncharacterized protein n=1 Tax=Tulasnella calospora MUT 4182 TaxID=1051891 RepID=A0A0C3KHI5_9AGAM|nr:hypothetical protein M407DRAFT_29426 [Tulasnella calospora MUT 4182]